MGIKEVAIIDNRIKQMLINDKKENPNKIIGLLKSEMFYILKNYMDIKIDDIELNIGVDNDGKYVITFNAEVSRIFLANYLM